MASWRGSTELLGREQVTLGEEALIVEHYLEIMQARLGARLHRATVEIAPWLASQPPPGLLLTLVENAIEHGVGPSLSGVSLDIRAQPAAVTWMLSVRDDGAGLPAGWHEGCRPGQLPPASAAPLFGERACLELRPLALARKPTMTVQHAEVPA